MNKAYKNVYPEAFQNIETYNGEKVPAEVFLDATGIAFNLFLSKPEELPAYVEELRKKKKNNYKT